VGELDVHHCADGGGGAALHALAAGGCGIAVVGGHVGGPHEETGFLQLVPGRLIAQSHHVGHRAALLGDCVSQIEHHRGAAGDGGGGGGHLAGDGVPLAHSAVFQVFLLQCGGGVRHRHAGDTGG